MTEYEFKELSMCIQKELNLHSFKELDIDKTTLDLPYINTWRRKTWLANHGIALIPYENRANNAGEFAQQIKEDVGKQIGYLYHLYPLGLQIVIIGENIIMEAEELKNYVDKYNNQKVVLQSIHLIDLCQRKLVNVRTWGQFTSGRYQDAISFAINNYLKTKTVI